MRTALGETHDVERTLRALDEIDTFIRVTDLVRVPPEQALDSPALSEALGDYLDSLRSSGRYQVRQVKDLSDDVSWFRAEWERHDSRTAAALANVAGQVQ